MPSKISHSIIQQVESLIRDSECKHFTYVRNGRRYLPAPLVGHVLNTVRDCQPHAFSPLYVVARDVRKAAESAPRDAKLIVWLPKPEAASEPRTTKLATQIDAKGAHVIWSEEYDTDAAALIARYVAALMIGVAVSYAPRELLVDFLSRSASASWKPLVDAAFRSNGGPLMRTYVEQVRSRRVVSNPLGDVDPWLVVATEDNQRRWQVAAEQKTAVRIVGLDIGGTQVKARCYDSSDWERPLRESQISWPKPPSPLVTKRLRSPGKKLKAGKKLLQALLKETHGRLCEGCGRQNNCPEHRPDAVGISLAAPVMDGVPVGISGVAAKLLGEAKPVIAEANPLRLHDIDLAAAVQPVFRCARTVVLNDGEADIRSSDRKLRAGGEGISVVIKEGTGVAFALYWNGVPVDILAETAKAVLNLRCDLQRKADGEGGLKDESGRFQQGQLSERCSKKKFDTLVRVLDLGLWNGKAKDVVPEEERDDVVALLVGSLLELAMDRDRKVRVLGKREIASRWLENSSGGKAWQKQCAKLGRAGLLQLLGTLKTGRDDSKESADLYLRAQTEIQHRDRSRVIGELQDDKSPDGNALTSIGRKPFPYKKLSVPMKAAVACAWVLGRWLADAIALACELFKAREVRLGGGPLSGKTGIFIALSARNALRRVYGFDVEIATDEPEASPTQLPALVRVPSHGPRDVKRVRLSFPAEQSSEGGPKGAAVAAFDAYLASLKLEQLRACRSWVADRVLAGSEAGKPFSPGEVEKAVRDMASTRRPWLLTDVEISNMLAHESSALALTRTGDDKFKSWLSGT